MIGELNTYRSEVSPDLFVTIPTAEAEATLAMVDGLRRMRLKIVRQRYRPAARGADADFLARVSTQILACGYALHGFERAAHGDGNA